MTGPLPDAPALQRHVPIETLRALSRIRGGRVAVAIAVNWVLLAGLVALALAVRHPALWVVAVLAIGNRQYALLLLVHECSHYLFRRSRAANDLLGNVFCAWPVGVTVHRYRALHFLHHRHLGGPADPDWGYYGRRVTPARIAQIVVAGMLGGRAIKTSLLYYLPGLARRLEPDLDVGAIRAVSAGASRWDPVGLVLVQAAILGTFGAAGAWWAYVPLWAFPAVTVVPTLNHLRTVAEHAPDADPEQGGATETTRTTVAGWLQTNLFAPVEFYYHHEHHLFPSVPFSRLAELHCILVQSGYWDAERDALRRSYPGTLAELCAKHAHGRAPRALRS
jgi:fatty acid desaturase